MDEVHGLEAAEVGLSLHPAGPDPGDVVFGKNNLAAEASGLEIVLEVGPGSDPGPGNGVSIGADIFQQPFLGEDLSPQHDLGVGVVVAELRPDLGDKEAMRDGRDDGDTIGFFETPGRLNALAPRFELFDRNPDFYDLSHDLLEIRYQNS